MLLSDGTIEDYCNQDMAKNNLISPFRLEQLQPASYDLILDMYHHWEFLNPGQFILASTLEKIKLPSHIAGRVEGKSSWARKGLIVHTAGFIDPGFEGTITLEITNLSKETIPLEVGCRIAQIAFQYLDLQAKRPYGHPELGSHYQGQQGATPSVL